MPAVTKTLDVRLADPTANKQRKLWHAYYTYHDALEAAFDANCTRRSETNDIVVPYDLSGYAKNALKSYVPKLCDDTYDASELHNLETHPVRYTNEGPAINHKPQNHYEWYLKLPHAHDDNLWFPIGVNPEHHP